MRLTFVGSKIISVFRHGDYPEMQRSQISTDDQVIQRLRAGGLAVVEGRLDPRDFPWQDLAIPLDGHPTVSAHRARAELLAKRQTGIVSFDP